MYETFFLLLKVWLAFLNKCYSGDKSRKHSVFRIADHFGALARVICIGLLCIINSAAKSGSFSFESSAFSIEVFSQNKLKLTFEIFLFEFKFFNTKWTSFYNNDYNQNERREN